MTAKKKPEVFEKEVRDVWGDKVELLTPYTRCIDKVLVRFKDCGHECWKSPNKLLVGHGCDHKECRYAALSKVKTRSTDKFAEDLLAKGYRYELLSEFTGVSHKITVKNLSCGHIYSAIAGNILHSGTGCPICYGLKDTGMFAEQVNDKYPNEYKILGEYVNNHTPILVQHKCGYKWEVIPKDLIRNCSCPYCKMSKGELAIEKFLTAHNLSFSQQYSFDDCRDKRLLRFDFAVFCDSGVKLIEFDGSQHFFHRNSGWNNASSLSSTQRRDAIKNEYCLTNNIPLLRIPYWKIDKIDSILASFLDITL